MFCWSIKSVLNNSVARCQLEDKKSLAKRSRGSVDARVEKEDSMVIVKSTNLLPWYIYFYWHTIMLGLVNVWLIYCRDCKQLGVQNTLKQKSFQAGVATSLVLWQAQRGCPSLSATSPPPPLPKRVCVGVPDDVRTDQVAVEILQTLQNQCNHHSLWGMWCVSLLHWGRKLFKVLSSGLG